MNNDWMSKYNKAPLHEGKLVNLVQDNPVESLSIFIVSIIGGIATLLAYVA